jgi:hypothetical protein
MYKSDNDGDVNSKYAMTLLGNPTRVLAESPLVTEVVDGRRSHDDRSFEYAQRLSQKPLQGIKIEQIVRLSWG